MNTRIVLPWPPRALYPNARPHFHERARAAKAYREQCGWLARSAEIAAPAEGDIMLEVAFYPPNQRMDTDNCFAAMKAGFDGIADALAVNDRRFAFTIRRMEPSKNGAVFVTVQEAV